MATYTPAPLHTSGNITQLGSSAGTIYTATGVVAILRTILAECATATHTFTLSIGTDGSGTRLFDAYPLTANVPAIFNGWWVVASAGIIQAFASAATSVNLQLSGYTYA